MGQRAGMSLDGDYADGRRASGLKAASSVVRSSSIHARRRRMRSPIPSAHIRAQPPPRCWALACIRCHERVAPPIAASQKADLSLSASP